ncbi:hypothetical protein PsYK624_123340 [Phanerochaete sordida]|uniref:Fucose-specific lectin n=1 Tax=Phanerochaete sordida TaxID=48140 RepID=A0A9P3GJI9_9APHY|nr:hypothetical protein PsYK624_123340 [Phanerochaete sordida]
MSGSEKCVALTYNTRLKDIRGYMSDADGKIWVASFQELHEPAGVHGDDYFKTQSVVWKPAGFHEIAVTGTGLYAVAWSSDRLSLLYQTNEGGGTCLREYYHNGTEWHGTQFCVGDLNPGTSIAVAIPGDGQKARVLYQNKRNDICAYTLEPARLRAGMQPATRPVTLASAKGLTGISVCVDKVSNSLLAYYQDRDGVIQEFNMDTNESVQVSAAKSHHIDSIAALSDNSGTRIYARSSAGIVTEFLRCGPRQFSSAISDDYYPRTSLLWIGENSDLHISSFQTLVDPEVKTYNGGDRGSTHEIYPPVIQSNGPATRFAPVAPQQTLTRSGTPTAAVKQRPEKVIQQIHLRIKCGVESIEVVYDDGKSSGSRGPSDGQEADFRLESHEYITHVWYTTDGHTVKGRMSEWFGSDIGLYGLYRTEGKVLVDLAFPTTSARSRIGLLEPTWEDFEPAGDITAHTAAVNRLTERFRWLQVAVTTLLDPANDVRNFTTRDVADGFEKLVEGVEMLQHDEAGNRNARIKASGRREFYTKSYISDCGAALETLLGRLESLSMKLQPVSGEFVQTVTARRQDGESLVAEFSRCQDSLRTYKQRLRERVDAFQTSHGWWSERVDLKRGQPDEHLELLRRVAESKGFRYSEPRDDYTSNIWGLQTWRRTIEAEAVQDQVTFSIISDIASTSSLWQHNRSQLDFLQTSASLLDSLITRLDALSAAITSTLSTLHKLIEDVKESAVLNGAAQLLIVLQMLLHELRQLRGKERSRELAGPLNEMLERLRGVESFTWGKIDRQVLLDVIKGISTGRA